MTRCRRRRLHLYIDAIFHVYADILRLRHMRADMRYSRAAMRRRPATPYYFAEPPLSRFADAAMPFR